MSLSPAVKQIFFRIGSIFVVKCIGFLAKIRLFHMIGSEGIGMYHMVYSLYVICLTMMIGGLPTVLTFITAGNQRIGWRQFKIISFYILLISVICSSLSFSFAAELAVMLGNESLMYAVRLLAPVLLIVPILSLLRGLLQGIEAYGVIAISEIIEQVVRVTVMLSLVSLWMGRGTNYAIGGAFAGAFAGAGLALIFLAIVLSRIPLSIEKSIPTTEMTSVGSTAGQFIRLSLFISLSRLITPVSEFLDALIIPRQLQSTGFTFLQASSIYGEVSGLASTIAYLPLIITAAIVYIMYPKLSAYWQIKKQELFLHKLQLGLKISWLWGVGSALLLFHYSQELSLFIFGYDAAAAGVRYLALIPLIAGIRDFTNTALWAMERKRESFIGLALGLLASTTCNVFLVSIPGFAYQGIALGVIAYELVPAVWNLRFLQSRRGSLSLQWNPFSIDLWVIIGLYYAGSFILGNILQVLGVATELIRYGQFIGITVLILSFLLIRYIQEDIFEGNKTPHIT